MNCDSSHPALSAVAAVQSFRRSHHHGQEADHQVNANATTTAPVVVAGNAAASAAAKKFSSSPMGHIPHDMNKFYMSSLLNLNQTQTSKENASASNLQGNRS